eukprot:GILJ01009787.1.p1 GENE.GILJ01009787.1~~GILJ01009787.1.p1  ORF type:complete len:1414 (+),score=330.67 GILJ01009787.1:621-4244(+)
MAIDVPADIGSSSSVSPVVTSPSAMAVDAPADPSPLNTEPASASASTYASTSGAAVDPMLTTTVADASSPVAASPSASATTHLELTQPESIPAADTATDVIKAETDSPAARQGESLVDEKIDLAAIPTVKATAENGQGGNEWETAAPRLFLVKWKGLSYMDMSWELETQLNDDLKIAQFYSRNRFPEHKALKDLEVLYRGPVKPFERRAPVQYGVAPRYKNNKTLRPYQLEGLNWMIGAWCEGRNCLLADEMGLGKTIQAMALLQHLYAKEKIRGPFLVVAPLSTLPHWHRTAEEWTDFNTLLYHDPQNGREIRDLIQEYEFFYQGVNNKGDLYTTPYHKFTLLITSYEVWMADESDLLSIPFQYMVVDEAHRLKNKQAKILQSLRKINCARKLILSGTPIQNNTEELWCLLNYIEPERFASLTDFNREFGDLASAEQVTRLHTMLKPYLLRRMKEEVEDSIPPLEDTIIDVELTGLQKAYYRALYDKNRSFLCKGVSRSAAPQLSNLEMELRKCCNHPYMINGVYDKETEECITQHDKLKKMTEASGKMVLLSKLLPKLKDENHKVLVFSQFTKMLDLLEEWVSEMGYIYERLDGAVQGNQRQAAIDRFNSPDLKRFVFLLSTKAGGLGINLTSADTVIIFDSDWNPQNDLQATARAHRLGQTQEVKVYRLITARTYEAEMFDRASKKLGLDQAVFHTGAFAGQEGVDTKGGRAAMSKTDIENLLKYGAYGLLDEDPTATRVFLESDIDQILNKNSRVVKYNSVRNAYSVSKSSFKSDSATTHLDVNDPDFWSKVLPVNTDTPPQRLLARLNEGTATKDAKNLKQFMDDVGKCVNLVVESKLDGEAPEDQDILVSVLVQISHMNKFPESMRTKAKDWIVELEKPKRRRKQVVRSTQVESAFTDSDSETKFKPPARQSSRASRRKSQVNSDDDLESSRLSDGDFGEGRGDQSDSANTAPRKKARRSQRPKRPSSQFANEDMHNTLCQTCGKGGELLCCDSCTLVFHLGCLDPPLTDPPSGSWSCPFCVAELQADADIGNDKSDHRTKRRQTGSDAGSRRNRVEVQPPQVDETERKLYKYRRRMTEFERDGYITVRFLYTVGEELDAVELKAVPPGAKRFNIHLKVGDTRVTHESLPAVIYGHRHKKVKAEDTADAELSSLEIQEEEINGDNGSMQPKAEKRKFTDDDSEVNRDVVPKRIKVESKQAV